MELSLVPIAKETSMKNIKKGECFVLANGGRAIYLRGNNEFIIDLTTSVVTNLDKSLFDITVYKVEPLDNDIKFKYV